MATPVFCCGFECGVIGISSTANALPHWQSGGTGTTAIDTTTVRSGARSLRVTTSGTSGGAITVTGTISSALIVARCYVRFTTLPAASTRIFTAFVSGTGVQRGIYFNSADSKLYTGSATGTYGATGVSVTTGQWYRLDLKVDSASGTIDGKVDGVDLGQRTGISTETYTAVRLCDQNITGTYDIYFDDIIVGYTAADYPWGAGYVNHFIPTSDGTHNVAGANDFEFSATGTDITNATTTAYTLIDDVPIKSGSATEYINMIAPPNATDYVEVVVGPASGVSTPSAGPRAADFVMAVAKGTGTGTMNIRVDAVDQGSPFFIVYNGDVTFTSPTIMYRRAQIATGASSAAWQVSNSGAAGYWPDLRLRGSTSDAAPDPWWASAMIEAEFVTIPVAFIPSKPFIKQQAVNRATNF